MNKTPKTSKLVTSMAFSYRSIINACHGRFAFIVIIVHQTSNKFKYNNKMQWFY